MDEELVKKQELKVNKDVKLDENINVNAEQKKLYAPQIPEEVAHEQNMTKTRLAKSFKQAKERKLNIKKINRESVVKSVTRVTKKRFLKADETVTENIHYYGSSEKLAEEREANAELLRSGAFAEKDIKADYRMSTDIKVKSRAGYQAFVQLSQFYPAMVAEMSREQFDEMVVKYGKKEGTPDRFEVLDKLTDKIMGIDPSDFDFTSDKAIAQKASRFESMNSMVSAYREMLEDNPHYVEHLKKTKNENEDDSYYDKLTKQMNTLCAMSDYYRIRTMIMKDSEYIARGGNIEQEIKETDTKGTRHLKEMLRASYHIAANLNRILGQNEIEPNGLYEGESKLSKDAFEATDKAFMINEDVIRHIKTEKNLSDQDALLYREDQIRDELERLRIQGDNIANYKTRDCLGKLTDISRTVEVYDDKEKKYKKKKVKHANSYVAVYGGASASFLMSQTTLAAKEEEKRRPDILARIKRLNAKMYDGHMIGRLVFDSKKYPELAKMEVSDMMSRMVEKIIRELSDDLSDSEIIELVERELIIKNKDFFYRHEADMKREKGEKLTEEEEKLEPIGKDEFEYYEDSYADAAMRSLYKHFALFEQIEQSIGAKAFILSPADFAIKYPDEMVNLVNTATTVTNILTAPNRDVVKKFIDDYNKNHSKRNKYKVDSQKFIDCADLYGSLNLKLTFFGYAREYLICLYMKSKGKNPIFQPSGFAGYNASEEAYEDVKEHVGKMGITAEKIDRCYEEHKNETVVKLMSEDNHLKEESSHGEGKEAGLKVSVYMYYHPEVMSEVMLNRVPASKNFDLNSIQPIDAFERAFKHGYLQDYTEKELKAYEESLKKRGVTPINVDFEGNLIDKNDPYKLKPYYDLIRKKNKEKNKESE
ncbi:MAG: hypothetical protein IKO61_12715 [Lachnospiraceae bacterium]|nr:hypothetical protein [Lachnospiraceae bacterium]